PRAPPARGVDATRPAPPWWGGRRPPVVVGAGLVAALAHAPALVDVVDPLAVAEALEQVRGEHLLRQLGRDGLDVAVAAQAGAGRDQLADDDVLLQAVQPVGLAFDRGLGEDAGRLLERRSGQP